MNNSLITYGTVQRNLDPKTTNNDISMILFGRRKEDGSICSFDAYNMYVYRLKLYEEEDLVREYIPALDDNDRPCLYETTTRETFYNLGSGEFLYQLKQ